MRNNHIDRASSGSPIIPAPGDLCVLPESDMHNNIKNNLLMPALGGIIQGLCIKIALYVKQNFTPEGSYPVLPILIMLVSGSVTVIYMTIGRDFNSYLRSKLFSPVNKNMLVIILKANLRMLVFGACFFVTLGLLKVL